jgi:DNA-binding response OmpR family regulator
MPNKVLVVEDEANLLVALKYNLNSEGYDVLTAEDGEAGLALARREKPDVVILDVMLPKLDGFEVCRILRRESDVRIIMLTARGEEIDRVVGLELGADDYVTKPFSVKELVLQVQKEQLVVIQKCFHYHHH